MISQLHDEDGKTSNSFISVFTSSICLAVSVPENMSVRSPSRLKLLSFSHVTEKKQLTFQSSRVHVVFVVFCNLFQKSSSFQQKSFDCSSYRSNPRVLNLELIAATTQSTNSKKFFLK